MSSSITSRASIRDAGCWGDRDRRTEDLVAQLARCDDAVREQQIRQELVTLNMPVAAAIARRFAYRGLPHEDLRQVAYLALTMAVQRFDPERGNPLLAYCVPTIRGEICRYFRDQGWVVRPPRRVQDLQPQVSRARACLTERLGRAPSVEEIAHEVGETPEAVVEACTDGGCFRPLSLDMPATQRSGTLSLGDLLPGQDDHGSAAAEARVALAPALRRLRPRDRHILQRRFCEGLTQREIAEEIGVTQMQVSRLLTRILRDLRRELGTVEAPTGGGPTTPGAAGMPAGDVGTAPDTGPRPG